MRLSDKVYDTLKLIQRWLPAVSAIYGLVIGLSDIWGWGFANYANEVSRTVDYIATILAGLLTSSTFAYKKSMNSDDIEATKLLAESKGDWNDISV